MPQQARFNGKVLLWWDDFKGQEVRHEVETDAISFHEVGQGNIQIEREAFLDVCKYYLKYMGYRMVKDEEGQ